MSGCFGNDPEDKYYENQMLNNIDPDEYVEQCAECHREEDFTTEIIYTAMGKPLCEDCLTAENA